MASPVPSPWVVFTLRGELDMSRTDELDELVAPAFQGDQVNAIFDLSDVSFMDSSALTWLLRIQDRIAQVGGRLRLVAPEGGNLMRLLSLTGLDGRFEIFPTTIEAEPDSSGTTDAIDGLLATFKKASSPFGRRKYGTQSRRDPGFGHGGNRESVGK